jgi:hypothetical protein
MIMAIEATMTMIDAVIGIGSQVNYHRQRRWLVITHLEGATILASDHRLPGTNELGLCVRAGSVSRIHSSSTGSSSLMDHQTGSRLDDASALQVLRCAGRHPNNSLIETEACRLLPLFTPEQNTDIPTLPVEPFSWTTARGSGFI